jgi:hypothetical protein
LNCTLRFSCTIHCEQKRKHMCVTNLRSNCCQRLHDENQTIISCVCCTYIRSVSVAENIQPVTVLTRNLLLICVFRATSQNISGAGQVSTSTTETVRQNSIGEVLLSCRTECVYRHNLPVSYSDVGMKERCCMPE